MNSTVHLVHLILCLLLLFESQFISFSRADNWSRGDEQSKTTLRQRKLSYSTPEEETLKMGQTAEQEGGGSRLDEQQHQDGGIIGDHRGYGSSSIESDELDREHEQAVISEQKGSTSNSMLMDSGKSARQSMDNLVKEMRSKAVNSAYADAAQLPMVEQTNNMIEQQQSFSGGRGAEHDHSGTDNSDSNIRIAVKSKRRFEFVPVHFDRDDMRQPRMIEISSDSMPLRLHFKSQSAAIVVTQSHMSPPMKAVEETVTMDQPYRISHEVHKPIIQTVKEFIQPYRTVIQTLKPVIEDIRTIVPKDSDVQHQHQGGISGSINQSNKPSFGGISGSTGGRANSADQWSPTIGMVMPRKGSLKTPPLLSTRPISPGYQLQQQQHQQQHTGNGRFGNRHSNYDSVKGSESRHRVQRRTQQDVDGFHRVHQRHHRSTPGPTINGNRFRGLVGSTQQSNSPMQFGSSELVYVPMMPDSANHHHHHHHNYDNNNNDDDDSNNNQQQLGDYFAAKKRRLINYNVQPHFEHHQTGGGHFRETAEEEGHFDRDMADSDRMETVVVSGSTDQHYPEFDGGDFSQEHSAPDQHLISEENFGNVLDDFELVQSAEPSNSRTVLCSGLNHRCPPGSISSAEWSEMHSSF